MGGLIGVATSDNNGLMGKSYVWKRVKTEGEKWVQFKFSYPYMGYIHIIARTSTPLLDLNITVSNWNEKTIRAYTAALVSSIENFVKMKKNDDSTMYLYVRCNELDFIISTNYGSPSYEGILDVLPNGTTSLTSVVGAS